MENNKTMKTIVRTAKVLLTIFVVLVLLTVILQKLSNNKITLFGNGIYTIVSESMLPEYEIGDMFLAREVKKEDIKVGDDIVYLGKVDSYKDKVITHRVVRIDSKIHTKGINPAITMEDPAIDYDQVYGRVVYRLTLLSIFSKIMNNNIVFYMFIFIPLTFLVFLDIRGIIEDKKALELEKEKTAKEEEKQEKEE
jgi:signal peptidase I